MTNKSLGQHWLKDRAVLESIADSADIDSSDTVLEIGPGQGSLTSVLLGQAGRVVAVEYDDDLASKLPNQFPGKALTVINTDFLKFDLTTLPARYKVVANVPYYITQKIVESLLTSSNKPEVVVLLVQQEVAEKLAARVGSMTAIAVRLQLLYTVQLGARVPKEYFSPAPKVDSQVVICKKRHDDRYVYDNYQQIVRVVKAGFSAPRKKLGTALAGGLPMNKTVVIDAITKAGLSPDTRAQELSLSDWVALTKVFDDCERSA